MTALGFICALVLNNHEVIYNTFGSLNVALYSGKDLGGGSIMESGEHRDQSGGALPGCEDKSSREVFPLEGPCPHCGIYLEFFSDELQKRSTLRCTDCRKTFTPADYLRSARSN